MQLKGKQKREETLTIAVFISALAQNRLMAPLTRHNLLQQVRRTISIYVTVFTNDACFELIKKRVRFSLVQTTPTVDGKRNPDFIITPHSGRRSCKVPECFVFLQLEHCMHSNQCFHVYFAELRGKIYAYECGL